MNRYRPIALLAGLLAVAPAWTQDVALRTVTLAAVGDTMVGSIYPSRAAMPPEDGRRVFERVKERWGGADIVFGNFEGTVASDLSSVRALGANSYRFLMPPESLSIYKGAGFNVLNVANNHAMDAGQPGRAATLLAMDEAGLAHVGSLAQPTVTVTTVQGVKVGFVATAPHMDCFPLSVEEVAAKILALKEAEGCALVVVSMHAGAEGEKALHVPKAKEIFLGADRGDVYAFAHGVVDAGADLVIGHGPHVPRGMEVYKGRLIAYSLGNFATHGSFNVRGVSGLGLVLEVVLLEDGTLRGLRIHSTKQDKGSEGWALGIPVDLDPGEEAKALVEKLSQEDFQSEISAYYLSEAQP
jgi:poly-gamma-glutamate capsule biosynthesis protein CapA/YwtB (metallophosphatase superfamily)